ncbi:hypothetical protein [Chroococcidiopsis thermalis]|uniref:hypothetical protein n=1 Tax=Chroococcidiopsis thermalis TaxID=54299 RepID=UPI0015F0E12B|nr:hypothetical protein [Chroococcidiopsis thermalis]
MSFELALCMSVIREQEAGSNSKFKIQNSKFKIQNSHPTPYTLHPTPLLHAPRTTYHASLIIFHTKCDRALLLQERVVVRRDR